MQNETQNVTGYTLPTGDQLKADIIAALRKFARQRPGLEFGNYGDVSAYRAEMRGITRDLSQALTLLRHIELTPSITGGDLMEAARHSGGRLKIEVTPLRVKIDYITGQYFPVEYRPAVARFCASVLWDWVRDKAMPPRAFTVAGEKEYATFAEANAAAKKYLPAIVAIEETYRGLSGGDWLRRYFRREFGRGIASRFFN